MTLKVGWMVDRPGYIGGAEMTQSEFKAAKPNGVDIIDCPSGEIDDSCDVFAIHNCITYGLDDLAVIVDKPAVRFWNDVGSWYAPEMMEILHRYAEPICCSPLQADYMGIPDATCIPPPVDLARFEAAAVEATEREGAVAIASWRNLGKGPKRVIEWASNGGGYDKVDFFGPGQMAPPGCLPIAYADMPAVLARYRTYVFLPTVIEPFGRVVAEAWAAGCELVVNGLVGALHWIETNPEAIRTAADDYWNLITEMGS